MAEANPRWIDAPEFQWNPERPYRAEPAQPEYVEPQFAEPCFAEPQFTAAPVEQAPANDDAVAVPEPAPIVEAAPRMRAHGYFVSRLVIGLAQGIGLLFLFAAQGALTSPPGLVLLFAPLLLLAGLGTIPGKLLLPWTVIAGIGLALLGALQEPGTTNLLLIAAVSLFLFIGQTMVAGWGKSGTPLAEYSAYHDSAWSLGLQCLLCALAALSCVMLVNEGFALVSDAYPEARPLFAIALLVPLAVALTSWLTLRPLLFLLLKILTWILPVAALLAAGTGVAGLLLQWQPPLFFCLVQAFLLLLCINASYGDGSPRPRWREILEAAGAVALAPLVLLGAAALGMGAAQGWTGPRILAAAGLGLLAGYAIFYIVSALISLGGGGWMKRLERANLVLALAALPLLAALAVH